jgi:hypothetical protein
LLRHGTANWRGGHIDDWGGWGWRHIAAKHGRSAADETATRAALTAPASTAEQTPTSMRYLGPEYEQNGAVCQRVVVVEYGLQEGDPADTPKGIITSYGQSIPDAG